MHIVTTEPEAVWSPLVPHRNEALDPLLFECIDGGVGCRAVAADDRVLPGDDPAWIARHLRRARAQTPESAARAEDLQAGHR